MNNRTFFAITGITISVVVIFGVLLMVLLEGSGVYPFKKEHYDIQITGMKDVYHIGEQYDFSYVISGYGYECGSKTITFPDKNGDTTWIRSSASCLANSHMKDFVYDAREESGTTFGHVTLQKAGHYMSQHRKGRIFLSWKKYAITFQMQGDRPSALQTLLIHALLHTLLRVFQMAMELFQLQQQLKEVTAALPYTLKIP